MKKLISGIALVAIMAGCVFAGNVTSERNSTVAGDRNGGVIAGDRNGGVIA